MTARNPFIILLNQRPLTATAMLAAASLLLSSCSMLPSLPGSSSGGVVTSSQPQASAPYRTQVAQAITRANASQVYSGRPPNPLYAVVVLQFEVNGSGSVQNLKALRVPGHAPETGKLAMASLQKASLPAPPGGRKVQMTESWLFNDDNLFQLRTLAEPQAAE
ncbi:hypothetical protein ACMYR3_12695 [Ampullimonas aquatilis]|uniref:hypothetical protein n=1 Tax=Ampullimonas aquatilis TaxID=1341549 RepID=UPI003C72F0FB